MASTVSANAVQGPAYTMQNVIIQPRAVNASGTIAGWSYFDASKQFHAAVYANGIVQDLGTLGGTASEATGINAAGQVVGASTLSNGLTHAFLYKNGAMIDLGTLPGGATSQATGINESGQIVGWSDTLQPNTSFPFPDHAFRYTNGQMTDLGNLGTNFAVFSHATAINALGQVVGWSHTDDGDRHAFLYSGGQMIDLHTLGGSESVALGVNGSGHVVGWSYTAGDAAARPFLYSGGSLLDLGPVNGYDCTAYSINSSDAVVGHSTNGPAFLYTPAAGMRELNAAINDSQYSINYAYAINENGQIIASGHNSDFSQTQFLLTPSGGTPTPTPTPVFATIQFSSSSYTVAEGAGATNITISRSGDTSGAAGVSYATSNGTAKEGEDYVAALGVVNFAAGENSKTFLVLIVDNAFVDGAQTVNLTLSGPIGAILAAPSTATVTITDNDAAVGTNPLDVPRSFVQLNYYDFLNRVPDTSGWDFWRNQITACGANAQCVEVTRINVSAAFFLSIEFQQTGYLVERMYKSAYGDATGTSTLGGSHQLAVPIVRFNEFLQDTQRIGRGVVVLQPGWEQALENNKQAYAGEFVATSRFVSAFPTAMTPTQFVDQLNTRARNVLSTAERTTAINLFAGAANTTNMTARAQALRQVAEDQDLYNAEFNRAFVLTEFFGYLRRNPNDSPDTDYTGYEFWLTKVNQFNGDYIGAEMVKAFINSSEYRQRFGP